MSGMKDLAFECEALYAQGYTIMAIARQLQLSTKEVEQYLNLVSTNKRKATS